MHYRILVKGHLDPSWQSWLEGLQVGHEEAGITTLSGPLPDQSALYGVLMKIDRLGLALLSVESIESGDSETPPGKANLSHE